MGCERPNVKAGTVANLTMSPQRRRAISAPLACVAMSVARDDEVLQRRYRRGVNEPVDPLRAGGPLKRRHDVMGGTIESAGGGDLVAVICQQRLRVLDGGIGGAKREDPFCRIARRGLDP